MTSKKIEVILTWDGYWVVTEEQKKNNKGFSPAMSISSLTHILMSQLGIKRKFGENITLIIMDAGNK